MEFVCFEWISEQTTNSALHNIKILVLYNEGGVFTARYGLSTYIAQIRFVLRRLNRRKPYLISRCALLVTNSPDGHVFRHVHYHFISGNANGQLAPSILPDTTEPVLR